MEEAGMSTFHGSDLEKIEEIYGIPKEDIVSFAANVSPLGISDGFIDAMKDEFFDNYEYGEAVFLEVCEEKKHKKFFF